MWVVLGLSLVCVWGVHAQCPPSGATAPVNSTSCSSASFSSGSAANWYSISANPFRMKVVNKVVPTSGFVNQLAGHSAGGTDYIFAATIHGVYVATSPKDTTFSVVDTARGANGVFHDGSNLYVATNSGIFRRSATGGTPVTNWTTSDGLPTNVVNEVFVSTDTVYAATNAGLYRKIGAGSCTQVVGIPAINVFDVYNDGFIILAGTGSGLYYTIDN